MIEAWRSLIASLPFAWAQYGFMADALLAVLLLAPVFAALGCMVINNHMAFFSDAIGHAALTGIAIGALLGLAQPLWAMTGFALVLAVGLSLLRRYSAASTDTIIGLIASCAVALGVVILSRNGGFARYSRYLIGDLLSVGPADLAWIAAVFVAVSVTWLTAFNAFFLVGLNTPLARSRGHHPWLIETAFAGVTAVAVTVSIQWVGLLVVNSLLILPAAASRNLSGSMRPYVALATAFSLFSCITGLISSYYFASASGATIVLVGMAVYAASLVVRAVRR
jgi:zinc transport system permease protein